MRNRSNLAVQTVTIAFTVFTFFFCPLVVYGDIEFSGGVTAEIDYVVDGSLWVYDANVTLYEPAHILGFVGTASGAVLDVYGGQIDYMLLISTSDLTLPEGIVTVYGTDFAVEGVPVDSNTTEIFLQGQTLSGVYENGTPFAFPVDCVIAGGGGFLYYQTVKLGWVVSEPDIELSQDEYNFEQVDIGSTQTGVVSVFNLGNASLTIQTLELEQSQQAQFTLTAFQVPVTLEPNSFIDLEILFSPVTDGVDTAVLSITSNDPNDPVVDILLTGESISVVLLPEEQIAQILDAYDSAVQEDLIQGIGNKKSATQKIVVFEKILNLADELIAAGYNDYALEVLLMIEKKCDGLKSPKDFIKGDGAAELNALINELIQTLQE
ncbi:MAG: choice-of-anchor D domain-containing protein [Planctomycetes bacterium]|nr:choice-of-anchor D domain-containing protein [Planctomycetota bacterium]